MKKLILAIIILLFFGLPKNGIGQNLIKKCKPYSFQSGLNCPIKICLDQTITCEINGVVTIQQVQTCSFLKPNADEISLICWQEIDNYYSEIPSNCTNSITKATFTLFNNNGISLQTVTVTDPNSLSRIYASIIPNTFWHPVNQINNIGPFYYDCEGNALANPFYLSIFWNQSGPNFIFQPIQ